ncbi:MAG: hypothetical protein ACRD0N_06720 [Acidimicrobiales bacterium]
MEETLGESVLVEDLHYGAVAVCQRLEELRPAHLILIGGVVRDRPPGTVERRRPDLSKLTPAVAQQAVGDAVTGYVSIDILVEVAAGLGALPPRTVCIEVEPASLALSDRLSAEGRAGLEEALAMVRTEVALVPLLDLAAQIGARCREDADRLGDAPAMHTLGELVRSIRVLGQDGRWGRIYAQREQLRRQIDSGETGEGMDFLDWALLWSLLEELDRFVAS